MPFVDPSRFSNPLRRFARTLVPGAEPEVAAPLPLPESQGGEPWYSVGRAVASLGGERVDGWRLQEWPGQALRAEFSACWRDADGRLWNVHSGDRVWLFLPDPRRRYEGVPVAARYQALSRDALLEDYLRVRTALGRPGLDEEVRETLQQTRERLEAWLALGGSGDQRCPCQSGKRYQTCCSRRLRDSL
jgi:hypothetical protein